MQPEQNKWFSLPPESATKGYLLLYHIHTYGKTSGGSHEFHCYIGTIIVLAKKNQRGEQLLFEQEIQYIHFQLLSNMHLSYLPPYSPYSPTFGYNCNQDEAFC